MIVEKTISGIVRAAALLPLVATLAACAQTGQATRSAAEPVQSDCMFARTLRDWRPLDDEHLLLFGPGHTAYLVQLVRPTQNLSFNEFIGVYDRDGSICPFGGDAIVLRGPPPERISIRSMQRLDDEELDETYVRFGLRPPRVMTEEPVEAGKDAQ